MPVYLIRCGENGPVKIGRSNDPLLRLIELQVAHFEQLRIIRLFEGGEWEENYLHSRFQDLNLRGEWHSFSRVMLGDLGLVEILPEVVEPPPSIIDVTGRAKEIGSRMRTLRLHRGLTQAAVAAALGVARSSIASIEAGHDLPGRDMLLRASRFFQVPVIEDGAPA